MRKLDYKKQLVDYFIKNQLKNYSPDSLKFALLNQGYSRVAIDQAYEEAVKEMAKKAPLLKEKSSENKDNYDLENNPIKVEPLTFWEKIKFFFKGKKI